MRDIFPERYSVLLTGPPGAGKQALCLDMADHYLKKGDKVVLLTSESSPEELEKRALDIGLNLTSNPGNLYFVDCYSWSLRQPRTPQGKPRNVVKISSPESLNEIIVKIERIMGIFEGRVRLIVHSLSPFFLYNNDKDVIKFIQLVVTRIKEEDSFILCALQEGVHSPSTTNAIRYLMDGALEMRFHEGDRLERQIRPHHLKDLEYDTRWRPFTIDKKGVHIDEE